MTVFEAFNDTKQQLLAIYDNDEATAIAHGLAEAYTNTQKTDREIREKLVLNTEQQEKWNKATARLLQHEPLQYVINEAWFYGLKFYVDENVLIPRPETEELVDWIVKEHGRADNNLHILDIGTGSGCIPISLKKALPNTSVFAVDLSEQAIAVAQKNAAALQAAVEFVAIDFLDTNATNNLPHFDIIVSNPPYIPQKDALQMEANVLQYEPTMALFVPDNDPIVFYKAIALFGKQHLNAGGYIYLELYDVYHTAVIDFYKEQGYQTLIKEDMQGKQRMLQAWF